MAQLPLLNRLRNLVKRRQRIWRGGCKEMGKVLLLGATGGIGGHALLQLLDRGVHVTTTVRSESRPPDGAKGNRQLTTLVRESGAIDMLATEMQEQVKGCDAVISCLGHRDVFGHPRALCFDTTRLVCDAIRALKPTNPIKYIVLNTALVDHPDGKTDPPRSLLERCLLWLLGALLPPHVDNVKTSHYLHDEIKTHDSHVEYCVVCPELLVNGDKAAGPAPAFKMSDSRQNGIFGGATTTRGNVGRFMADLVTDSQAWSRWKGKFPQIIDVKDAKSK